MVNAWIGMRLPPFFVVRILAPVLYDVFVNFFLQVNANSPVSADDFVGADARIGRNIPSWISKVDIGPNISYGVMGTLDGGSHELIGELLARQRRRCRLRESQRRPNKQ